MLITNSWHHLRDLTIAEWLFSAALMTLTQVSYVKAFQSAPPEEVDLINYLWPLFVVLGSGLLPKERWSWVSGTSAFIGLFALWLLLTKGTFQVDLHWEFLSGYLWALNAAVCWALFTLFCRSRKKLPIETPGLICGIASATVVSLHLISHSPMVALSPQDWAWIAFLGVLTNGLSYFLWQYSLRRSCIQTLGTLSYLTPLLSVSCLVICNKASYSWYLAAATLLICFASALTQAVHIYQTKRGHHEALSNRT